MMFFLTLKNYSPCDCQLIPGAEYVPIDMSVSDNISTCKSVK